MRGVVRRVKVVIFEGLEVSLDSGRDARELAADFVVVVVAQGLYDL